MTDDDMGMAGPFINNFLQMAGNPFYSETIRDFCEEFDMKLHQKNLQIRNQRIVVEALRRELEKRKEAAQAVLEQERARHNEELAKEREKHRAELKAQRRDLQQQNEEALDAQEQECARQDQVLATRLEKHRTRLQALLQRLEQKEAAQIKDLACDDEDLTMEL